MSRSVSERRGHQLLVLLSRLGTETTERDQGNTLTFRAPSKNHIALGTGHAKPCLRPSTLVVREHQRVIKVLFSPHRKKRMGQITHVGPPGQPHDLPPTCRMGQCQF